MPVRSARLVRPRSAALTLVGLLALSALTGCAAYATPGRGADLAAFGVRPEVRDQLSDPAVVRSLGKQPLASLPTGIAVARVQAPGYRSETTESWGTGQYSIVTTRDVETDQQVERLNKLPLVTGIAPINRLLLPRELQSDLELRNAAAQLHAGMLLIYTLDTTFRVQDKAAPLTLVTLGLSPNQQAQVVTTASAVLLDTHNGYVYGVAEATDRSTQLASAWTSTSAVDDARRRTETKAFDKLVDDLEKVWGGVVRIHGPNVGPAGARIPVQ